MAGFTVDFQLFFKVGIAFAVTHDFISGMTVNAGHASGEMDIRRKFEEEPVARKVIGARKHSTRLSLESST